jgi:fatty acid desaturase
MTLPTTRDRVPNNTSNEVNRQIETDTEARVRRALANPARIDRRIRELEEEWDIERAIEMNASALAFLGTVLGFFLHPYWLALTALVTAFLFQHALQGWCPPVPILRRMGFRTSYEIEEERQALKAVRGDYSSVISHQDPARAAVEAAAL